MTVKNRVGNFVVYEVKPKKYVVWNSIHPFQKYHTHIDNYRTANYIAYLAANKKLPTKHELSPYLLKSLLRITDNRKYRNLLETHLAKKKETPTK